MARESCFLLQSLSQWPDGILVPSYNNSTVYASTVVHTDQDLTLSYSLSNSTLRHVHDLEADHGEQNQTTSKYKDDP